jgi:hypothetical protein
VIAILTESVDLVPIGEYLKQCVKEEGNENVTNGHGLKMQADDCKIRMTDVAYTELGIKKPNK